MKRYNITKCFIFIISITFLLILSCQQYSGTIEEDIKITEEDLAKDSYIIKGVIVDLQTNEPIENALVTLHGREAQDLTNENGEFFIVTTDKSEEQIITVSSPGYKNFYTKVKMELPNNKFAHYSKSDNKTDSKDIGTFGIAKKDPVEVLDINVPPPNATLIIPPHCTQWKTEIGGFVSEIEHVNFLIDIAFVIDTSGSVSESIGDDMDGDGVEDSIYKAEVLATLKFLDTLDPQYTQVTVITFAREAIIEIPLTNEFDKVKDVLKSLLDLTPQGGTNFNLAINVASEELTSERAQRANNEKGKLLESRKFILFLTDGIPTLPSGSGLTQEDEDIHASLEAAELASKKNIAIIGNAIGSEASLSKLTTLPSISTITNGAYFKYPDIPSLPTNLQAKSIVGVDYVEVTNITMGGVTVRAKLNPTGHFSTKIPIIEGKNEISIKAVPDDPELAVEKVISLFATKVPKNNNGQGLKDIKRPAGGELEDKTLYNYLTSQFPDAVEEPGIELYEVFGESGTFVKLIIDFIYKESAYKSDVGYAIVDPSDLPKKVSQIIDQLTVDNILFNYGIVSKNGAIPPGTYREEILVPAGSYLLFFVIPNQTLDQYLTNVKNKNKKTKSPLFSLSSLNPGNMDQILTFRSEYGQLDENAPFGPTTIFAFEDLSIVESRSDQDFDDVIMAVSAPEISPYYNRLECSNK